MFSCGEDEPDCIYKPERINLPEKVVEISHVPKVVYNDTLSLLTLCSDENNITVDQITPGLRMQDGFEEIDLNGDSHLDLRITFEDSNGVRTREYVYSPDSLHYELR